MFLVIKIPATKCNVPYAFMPDPYRFSGEVTADSWGQISKTLSMLSAFENMAIKYHYGSFWLRSILKILALM